MVIRATITLPTGRDNATKHSGHGNELQKDSGNATPTEPPAGCDCHVPVTARWGADEEVDHLVTCVGV